MKDVGEFDKRNKEYKEKFDRRKIIQDSVFSEEPTIFDIGGHKGQSINYLKELFPGAIIYSFEPDPDSFKILSKKQSRCIKVFNLAISDKVGHASFYKNKIILCGAMPHCQRQQRFRGTRRPVFGKYARDRSA